MSRDRDAYLLGAIAQAARNYLLSGSDMDKAILDRLAAEAIGCERLWFRCHDCGALAGPDSVCNSCGYPIGAE